MGINSCLITTYKSLAHRQKGEWESHLLMDIRNRNLRRQGVIFQYSGQTVSSNTLPYNVWENRQKQVYLRYIYQNPNYYCITYSWNWMKIRAVEFRCTIYIYLVFYCVGVNYCSFYVMSNIHSLKIIATHIASIISASMAETVWNRTLVNILFSKSFSDKT